MVKKILVKVNHVAGRAKNRKSGVKGSKNEKSPLVPTMGGQGGYHYARSIGGLYQTYHTNMNVFCHFATIAGVPPSQTSTVNVQN